MASQRIKAVKTPLSYAQRRRYCRARRLLRSRFCRDERGMTAVEFAIVSPIFFFLLFVIAETALVFIAEQVMDNAVFETARMIRTGQAQTGTWNTDPDATPAAMTPAEFEAAVCARMSVFVDCASSTFYLHVKSFPTYDDMVVAASRVDRPTRRRRSRRPAPSTSASRMRSSSCAPITNGRRARFSAASRCRTWPTASGLIGSFAAFCNEPYDTTSEGCGGTMP